MAWPMLQFAAQVSRVLCLRGSTTALLCNAAASCAHISVFVCLRSFEHRFGSV